MTHITINTKGQELRPKRCPTDASLFTCPFCTTDVYKPKQYHQIMTHLAGHKLRAVEHGDQVIYSCNLGCGTKARHFHCCQCPKTFINKFGLKSHLCSIHPISTCTREPKPDMYPPQDPHSQQLEPQPTPKPPLQQTAPYSPKLADPPENEQISMQCLPRHITLKHRGEVVRPKRCPTDASLFTCPFCSTDAYKPCEYHQIMTHLAGHKLRAVEHGDQVMYRCNLGCDKKASHFHCCECPRTFTNKQKLKKHLGSFNPIATSTQKTQPVDPLPPSQHLEPHSLPKPPLQQPTPRSKKLAYRPENVGMQTPVQFVKHITVNKKGQVLRPTRCPTDASLFTCPFCPADVYKPKHYHQIMTHLAVHQVRAVEHGDQIICSCNLYCDRKARHFHCCECPKTFFSKRELKSHLYSAHPITTGTPEPLSDNDQIYESTSQQPEPCSPDLADSSENEQISVQCFDRHITIQQRGQEPRPKCFDADASLFTCPFCTTGACKPGPYQHIMTHLAEHKLRAVEHGDQVMYRCNLGCDNKARHSHCCHCPKICIEKRDLERHLRSAHPEAQPVTVKRKPNSALCPHCGIMLNSKNLKKHIERKHCAVELPTCSALPAQCVDKTNGIYAVSKSFSEPYNFIHVAKKIWGSSHKVMCGMDICNHHVEMAQKNDVLVKQCVHLNAVDNCSTVAPTEDLSEDVLTRMVKKKWLENKSLKRCVKRQKQAVSDGATFTSLVTIGKQKELFYVSIYEPAETHYSKLGRVLVCYSAITDSWHCPCGKTQSSCIHMSIAKWCLHQMKKLIFKNKSEIELLLLY